MFVHLWKVAETFSQTASIPQFQQLLLAVLNCLIRLVSNLRFTL